MSNDRIYTSDLLESLKSQLDKAENTPTRQQILLSFKENLNKEILPLLEYAISREEPALSSTALYLAVQLGSDAENLVTAFLMSDTNNFTKERLIGVIGDTKDPFWLPLLLDVLTDFHNSLRQRWERYTPETLIMAIAKMGNVALPQVTGLLQSADQLVVKTSVNILGKIGGDEAINELANCLGDPKQSDDIQKIARDALWEIGGEQAEKIVQQWHKKKDVPWQREVVMQPNWSKRILNEEDVYKILEQRATIFYDIITSVNGFTPILSKDTYLDKVSSVIADRAHAFLLKRGDAFKQLNYAFLTELPKALVQTLRSNLPSNEDEIRDLLYFQAFGFHKALLSSRAYVTPISDAQFQERINDRILEYAKRVFDNKADLDLTLLVFPETLIYPLRDVLACFNYDFEFGYRTFFERAVNAFERTPYKLKWTYDKNQQQLQFSINDRSWLLENIKLEAHLDTDLYNKLKEIEAYLAERKWKWYDIITGDQTASIMLLPAENADALKQYLPDFNDRRSQLFYSIDNKFHPVGSPV